MNENMNKTQYMQMFLKQQLNGNELITIQINGTTANLTTLHNRQTYTATGKPITHTNSSVLDESCQVENGCFQCLGASLVECQHVILME